MNTQNQAATPAQAVTISALCRELGKFPEEVEEMVGRGLLPRPSRWARGALGGLYPAWERAELDRHARKLAGIPEPEPEPAPRVTLVSFDQICKELGKPRYQVEAMVEARMLPRPVGAFAKPDGFGGTNGSIGPMWSRAELDRCYTPPTRGGQALRWLARTAGALKGR